MKNLIKLIILLPIAIALIVFSVTNRQEVRMGLDPFNVDAPALSVTLPFFVFLFAALLTGMFLGSMITWFKDGKIRRELRDRREEVSSLSSENSELKNQTKEKKPEFAPGLPVLSSKSA